jgi:hypothetical protein
MLGDRAGLAGGLGVSCAEPALVDAASAASRAAVRTFSTMRTWRSAPCATSPTAPAISSTARPVSSDVVAICCDALPTVAALVDTSPIISASCARMRL